jgi:1,4-alpha-glucan branching enzyme
MKSHRHEHITLAESLEAIARGQHRNPFSVLGMQWETEGWVVRCFEPGASAVSLVGRGGNLLAPMERVHPAGIFAGSLPQGQQAYRLRVAVGENSIDREDPYRFPSVLGELDLHLIGEGRHQRLYEVLGAHPRCVSGVNGVQFAVWAPNALRVSVVGSFNDWDGRKNVMRFHPGIGVWDIFIPEVGVETLYKYELLDATGSLLPLKSDPFARYAEAPPGNASIVYKSAYVWADTDWMAERHEAIALNRPQSIYEVHLGSWRRRAEENGGWLTYGDLADELVGYVEHMGFTHVEFLPVSEHPFDGSWGYQPIGLYAPTRRFGKPDDLKFLVDRFHQAGIGVIVDWVPAHFPRDQNGLGNFDGTALYEHQDPRRGSHPDWGTLVFNYGRTEVLNYLITNALYWVDEFHFDGLRVDAVASMLYLDYSRKAGEWLPNEHGGKENLQAIEFLKRLNEEVHQRGSATIAEESTAWPAVSKPTYVGGLGFSYKWNMGWMHDTLAYMHEDAVHRKYHHDQMTFGLMYAFTENFVLPLSHDEVVHGKGSLLERMPGDEWQKFANLRALYGYMYGYPGKKLLFMGNEFAQRREWNHDESLDWHLCDEARHSGVQRLIRDLNHLYRETPALYDNDFDAAGFEWIDWGDRDNSVFSWIRRARNGDFVVVVTNLTPVIREDYRVGVPSGGAYAERINTDAAEYGGSGIGNLGSVEAEAEAVPHWERSFSLRLRLPPLATVILQPRTAGS